MVGIGQPSPPFNLTHLQYCMGKIFDDDTLTAFTPFFDESIVILHGSSQSTVAASVFPIEDQDPFSETTQDSDLRWFSVTIGVSSGQVDVSVGDKVQYCGKDFNVMEISQIGLLIDMKIRG